MDKEELVEEITKLAGTGASSAQIGAVLRDTHAVTRVRLLTGQSMMSLLKEQNLAPQLPEDLSSLLRRVVHLQQHLAKHPYDLANKRGLNLIESRIRRLAKYYKQRKILPADWHYSAETAALQVE
jgi:small subunit ribosomal protein S15